MDASAKLISQRSLRPKTNAAALCFALLLGSLVLSLLSCTQASTKHAGDTNRVCPSTRRVNTPIAPASSDHLQVAYWEALGEKRSDFDDPLLKAPQIAARQAALREHETLHRDLLQPIAPAELLESINERLAYIKEKVDAFKYRTPEGKRLPTQAFGAIDSLPELKRSYRQATGLIPVRCGPYAGAMLTEALDADFDRNTCSTIRKGELVEVLADWSPGLRLIRTKYTMGWVLTDAALGDSLPADSLPATSDPAPLTRRALLKEAFGYLEQSYGWGGMNGGFDCSRFLLEVFKPFGVELPRHSKSQAAAGSFSIDVGSVQNAQDKLALIDTAYDHGAVLLQFPGHIMLYLGRDASDQPMVIHAFSEFVTPCDATNDPKDETINRVDKVTVTDLSLGAGSSRTDFLSRITTITVLGRAPDDRLRGVAQLRPAATPKIPTLCDDSNANAIFESPAKPNHRQSMRVVSTNTNNPGSATLALYQPDGNLASTTVQRLAGPPHTFFATVDRPEPGKWTAVVGDGAKILSCEKFTVFNHPAKVEERLENQPVWVPAWRWEEDTENFFAAFIEQLFSQQPGQPETWPDMQSLTRDPARNLLFDHRHAGEDAELRLQPDCADFPYFLRGYFAYKLRLPFAFRECTRGSGKKPPVCEPELRDNLQIVEAKNSTEAFQVFLRKIAGTVHSASARTLPLAENSDVYPISLKKTGLRPGTVFADPYGHLLIIARWVPQGAESYGVLIGADAQPDGTVGQRRFWRGSFLFDTDTSVVGPGFKAWRPLHYNRKEELIESRTNAYLRRKSTKAPLSKAQYEGTSDDFYDTMDGLINPRPLRASAVLATLVDALEETVGRRVVSVNNGEAYVQQNATRLIEMPKGYRLFETTGPWEDYSTPSRDMRLLISIDAVTKFPAYVERKPERFGIAPKDAHAAVVELRKGLSEDLASRELSYARSDGSNQRLSFQDVVARQQEMEVAYNPNDCVELRWGASLDTDEGSTCKRRAPDDQQQRMLDYRPWFRDRKRPPR